MKTSHTSTAKDVFAYLFTIITLYIGVFSLLALLFQYIEFQFPDSLDGTYSNTLSVLRTSLSSLIVVWPVFLIMSRILGKDLRAHKEKADMWVRKWLLYLTLFIAGMTVVIDLIVLLNSFLGGELTVRFVLKVLAVLVVAVFVLWYYQWDLHHGTKKSHIPLIATMLSSVFILGWIIAGFFLVGSPGTQRALRMDEARITHLSEIQANISSYWQQVGELPNTLTDVEARFGYAFPEDPFTHTSYEYKATGDLTYELCATFEQPSRNTYITGRTYYIDRSEDWSHDAGSRCFARSIDTAMYPPLKMIN